MRRIQLAFGLAVAAVVAAPSAASAGGGAQDSWAAWIGCWRVVDASGAAVDGSGSSTARLVCVVPGGAPQAMRMLTVEDGAVVDEASLTADGAAHAVEAGGCRGTERAQWSQDGRRVYLRTELECEGVRRFTTGVLAFVSADEWVDVQALRVWDQHATRTIRYRAVRPEDVPAAVASRLPADRSLAQEAARLHASAPLDVAGVMEASGVVDAPAVEALLAAGGHGFELNAATLVALEERGVAPSTIDVMIALSYPERFAVRAPARGEPDAQGWMPASSVTIANYCYDSYFTDLRYRSECARYYGLGGYSRYGSLSWGYSPWGYDPYGWRYGRGPAVIIVRPDREDAERGSVVKGQGYTRGSSPATGRSARPRSGGSDDGGARPQPDRGSASPSTPRAQPSSSSGSDRSAPSGGSDTGRTAKPRSGGGDDGR